MGTIVTAGMTLEEFERLEDTAEELELLEGDLIRMPPPQKLHMEICERLYDLLKALVSRLRETRPALELGKVHIEMGYLIAPRSWVRPDVSLTNPHQRLDRYYEGAPLIAFEIVSEHDTARDLDRKVAEYLAHGSSEVWVIYPDTRHAHVYRPDTVNLESRAIRTDLLPGIEIPLDQIL